MTQRNTMYAVCTVLLLAAGCSRNNDLHEEEIAVVSRVTLRDVVKQTGEVKPIVKVDLKSEASGKIERVFVREGEKVDSGQQLLIVDPERLLNRKASLDLNVKESHIRLSIAERNLERARQLAQTGSVSARQIEDLESEYELRKIALRKVELDRQDILDQLRRTTVIAPMAGVLTALNVEESEIVVSATSSYQAGTAIGTIANIDRLEVITQIGEVDYPKLALGQRVEIRPEAAEHVYTSGTITFLSLTAKKRSSDELGTFEVRISVDSLVQGVVPGVNVNVDFVVLEVPDVLAVPYTFVRRRGSGSRATVTRKSVDERGRAAQEAVTVSLGSTDYRHWEVLSGLAEGDTVVNSSGEEQRTQPPGGAGGAQGRRR